MPAPTDDYREQLRLLGQRAGDQPNTLAGVAPTPADAWDYNSQAAQDWLAYQRSLSDQRGLWNSKSGWPTQAGIVDAARQMSNAVMLGTEAPEMPKISTPTQIYRVVPQGVSAAQAFSRPGLYAFTRREDAAAFQDVNGGHIYSAELAPHEQHRVDDFNIEMMHRHEYGPDDPKVFGNDGSSDLYGAGEQLYIRDPSLLSSFSRIGRKPKGSR